MFWEGGGGVAVQGLEFGFAVWGLGFRGYTPEDDRWRGVSKLRLMIQGLGSECGVWVLIGSISKDKIFRIGFPMASASFDSGEVPRREKMLCSGIDPESYDTEHTLVYEVKKPSIHQSPHHSRM